MKKAVFSFAALFLGLCAFAQNGFPKSQKEDRDHIMSDAYWNIWNPEVQAKIDADIDANRKADAVLDLGLPAGTEVTIEQVSHDFIFGAHIFNFNQLGTHERNERYKALYGTLFNSATIAFYWKTFETEPGRMRFATEYWDTEEFWNNCENPKAQTHWRRPASDQVVEFCESKGIRLHGHTIIWDDRHWHHPGWIFDRKMIPAEKAKVLNDAYKSLTNEELTKALPEYSKTLNTLFEKRVTDLAKHYGGRLHSWDVVNESATDFRKMTPGDGLMRGRYGIMPGDYTFKAFQTAQKVFPNQVKLNINDFIMGQDYLDQVKDLTDRGCKIDIMGAQMHLFNPKQCLDIADGKEIQTPDQIWKWTELLGQAGKPIHLSEITITSPGNDARGRQIQAIIAQNLYRLWFSVKPMMGITWWNVVDDCGAPGEPSVSGLFDRDMQPKPSYFALDNLINHEWKTNLTARTDRNGVIRFRGFKGTYRVTWKDAYGGFQTREFHLGTDGDGLTGPARATELADAAGGVGGYLPAWQEGYFDIHHIATGKGEAQFMVFPDGTTLLIDTGDMTGNGGGWAVSKALPDSSNTPAKWVANYIDHFSPTPGRIDYAVLSHFHSDHMGSPKALRDGPHGYKIAGLMELGEYEKIGTLVDRGYPSYDFPSVEMVEGMNRGGMPHYKRFVEYQVRSNGMKAEKIDVGSHKQFTTRKKGYDFDVWNVAGNLQAATGKGKRTKAMNTEDPIEAKFDENMFSIAFLLRYGDFKYYTGGDLPGKVSTKPGSRNRDYESQIVDLIAPCNVMKANHHGYDDTTNPNFLWKMAPDYIIVPSIGGGHPRSVSVDRFTDPLYRGRRIIYATSAASRERLGEERFGKIKDWGHVVIRVFEGGAKYQIFILDATSKDYRIKSRTDVQASKRDL